MKLSNIILLGIGGYVVYEAMKNKEVAAAGQSALQSGSQGISSLISSISAGISAPPLGVPSQPASVTVAPLPASAPPLGAGGIVGTTGVRTTAATPGPGFVGSLQVAPWDKQSIYTMPKGLANALMNNLMSPVVTYRFDPNSTASGTMGTVGISGARSIFPLEFTNSGKVASPSFTFRGEMPAGTTVFSFVVPALQPEQVWRSGENAYNTPSGFLHQYVDMVLFANDMQVGGYQAFIYR